MNNNLTSTMSTAEQLLRFELIMKHHKSRGYKMEFDGWRIHKVRHHAMKEEYIPSNKVKCFGVKSVAYIDIVPHDGRKYILNGMEHPYGEYLILTQEK